MGRHHQEREEGRFLGAVGGLSALLLVASLAIWGPPAGSAASAAALPRCTTGNLDVWLDTMGSAAAGSTFYHLNLTNTSSHSCTLEGFPGVSGITQAGIQLGRSAGRGTGHAATLVTLRSSSVARGIQDLISRSTATVILQVTDVFNFPTSKCGPTTAAGLRVYPPGQKESTVVPFPFVACGRTGPTYIYVEAAQKYIPTE